MTNFDMLVIFSHALVQNPLEIYRKTDTVKGVNIHKNHVLIFYLIKKKILSMSINHFTLK